MNTCSVPLVDIRDHSWSEPENNLNGPKKKTNDIRHYIPEMTLTDYMCQEKNEEKNLPALKTALTHRYNDSKTT